MSLLRAAIEREFNPRRVGIEEFCELQVVSTRLA